MTDDIRLGEHTYEEWLAETTKLIDVSVTNKFSKQLSMVPAG